MRQRAAEVAQQLRLLANSVQKESSAIFQKYPNAGPPNTDPEQQKKLNAEWMPWNANAQLEADKSLRPEAIAVRDDILRRLYRFSSPPTSGLGHMFFQQGVLNPTVIRQAADQLEALARELP
jgi:hypothetical protein